MNSCKRNLTDRGKQLAFKTLEWTGEKLILIDQTRLPIEEIYLEYSDYREVATAIKTMVVRGAPAIGVTAAYGLALAARELAASELAGSDEEAFSAGMDEASALLAATRPTAVNLFWAIERMNAARAQLAGSPPPEVAKSLEEEAKTIHKEDVAANRAMGGFGAALMPNEVTILTHCNAGALATADYGTALGVIRACVEAGKKVRVFADETRPLLQGARLTAWELAVDGIDVTLICDNMAGALMRTGAVDAVVVGADRHDELGPNSGSAYVYERDEAGTWTEVAKLLASDGAFFDYFGNSVAISGETAVVVAVWDDDLGRDSGSATS